MNSINDVWDSILQRLKKDLTETTICTWFDETTALALEGDTLVLHCANDFKRITIEARYMSYIQAALKDLFSMDMSVCLLDNEGAKAYGSPAKKVNSLIDSNDFTFSTFVVGPSNKLAYAAAYAVAENPAIKYNPLFIYGDSGLGKTHLIYAIAQEMKRNNPNARIVYVKGDDFTNELVQSIQHKTPQEFRDKYRAADLLLVDDVQFIAGKQQTQEEFFHTFNTLYEARKQIVLTSDRPPKEMAQLEDRLRTRFEWGMLADVQPPDFETRLAIVKNKAMMRGIILSDDISTYIAENVTANVRQLEGTINKILAYRDIMDSDLDEEAVNRAIRDMLRNNNEYVPTAGSIISSVSKYYDIDENLIRGQSRAKEALNPRQVAMYLIRRMTNLSMSDIGNEFGGRDHTTVLHSLEKIEKRLASDVRFAEVIRELTTTINNKH